MGRGLGDRPKNRRWWCMGLGLGDRPKNWRWWCMGLGLGDRLKNWRWWCMGRGLGDRPKNRRWWCMGRGRWWSVLLKGGCVGTLPTVRGCADERKVRTSNANNVSLWCKQLKGSFLLCIGVCIMKLCVMFDVFV